MSTKTSNLDGPKKRGKGVSSPPAPRPVEMGSSDRPNDELAREIDKLRVSPVATYVGLFREGQPVLGYYNANRAYQGKGKTSTHLDRIESMLRSASLPGGAYEIRYSTKPSTRRPFAVTYMKDGETGVFSNSPTPTSINLADLQKVGANQLVIDYALLKAEHARLLEKYTEQQDYVSQLEAYIDDLEEAEAIADNDEKPKGWLDNLLSDPKFPEKAAEMAPIAADFIRRCFRSEPANNNQTYTGAPAPNPPNPVEPPPRAFYPAPDPNASIG